MKLALNLRLLNARLKLFKMLAYVFKARRSGDNTLFTLPAHNCSSGRSGEWTLLSRSSMANVPRNSLPAYFLFYFKNEVGAFGTFVLE